MKKILLVMFTILFTFFGFFADVQAVPSTVKTSGNPKLLSGYVGGTKFYKIPLTDGTMTYCLNIHKNVPRSKIMYRRGELDAGIAYLMENGYPKKSFVGNGDKDYYITQTAVWWYLDRTQNASNLSNKFKTTSSDPNHLRPHIQRLVNGAIEAKNRGYKNPTLTLSAKNLQLMPTSDFKYYQSEPIVIQGSDVSSAVNLTLENAPQNTEIISQAQVPKKSFSVGESFQVRIPIDSMKKVKTVQMRVRASATGSVAKAYEFRPQDNSLQNVVSTVLYKENKNVESSVSLTAAASSVQFLKIDQNTKKPLEGATLELKNAEGKIIETWTTSTEAHEIWNLPNGTYILKETKAPLGYKLQKESITFSITDQSKEMTISISNQPKSNVVQILKIDKETQKPLAGAEIVVRDSNNEVVKRFVTTEEAYVLQNLEDGKYTVEEVKAPNGYMKSDEIFEFEIDDEHTSHQITIEDYKEVIVPITSSSTMMYGIGIVLFSLGVFYVYHYRKVKKSEIR